MLKKRMRNKRAVKLIRKYNVFNEEKYMHEIGCDSFSEDALLHFVKNGNDYLISPAYRFDIGYYLSTYPDVKESGVNALYHYLSKGFYEGRKPEENSNYYMWWSKFMLKRKGIKRFTRNVIDSYIIAKSKLFDSMYYCDVYEDVGSSLQNSRFWKWRDSSFKPLRLFSKIMTTPITHYVRYGVYEGRNPHRGFNTKYYVNRYPDVRQSGMNPYAHYVKYGLKEGRVAIEKKADPIVDQNKLAGEFKQLMMKKDPVSDNVLTSVVFVVTHNTTKSVQRLISLLNQKHANLEIFVICPKEVEEQFKKDAGDIINKNSIIKEFISADVMPALGSVCEKTKGDFLILSVEDVIYDEHFLKETLSVFRDDIIVSAKAESVKADEKEYTGTIVNEDNYRDFLDNYQAVSSYVFRNYGQASLYTNDILTYAGRLGFIIENSMGGICAKVSTAAGLIGFDCEMGFELEDTDIKTHISLLSNLNLNCHIPAEKIRKLYEKYRTAYMVKKGINILSFKDVYDISKIFAKKLNPTVVVSLFAFTHGGGEIMPIRIANKLKEKGVNVIVHNYGHDCDEGKVRNMLRRDIAVITTKHQDELALYLKMLRADVINTHHNGNQLLVAKILGADEYLGKRLAHIATQHGMYEAFDKNNFDYIIDILKGNLDKWTYVADKNLTPFKERDDFDETMFIKIANGVDKNIDKSVTRESLGISKDAFVISLASRAIKEKGWEEAVKACGIARKKTGADIILILVGEGPVYEELKGKTPDYVHLIGFSDKVQSIYSISDLTILPSYYKSESAPLTVIESLVAGTPVVATDIGEIRSMVEYSGTKAGECIPLENGKINIKAFADAISELAGDKNKYNLAKEAAVKYGERFEMNNAICQYIDVYMSGMKYDNGIQKEYRQARSGISLLESSLSQWTSKKVSVIVPCYNHAPYLKKRLDSIYNQTYKNFEVILMDDCSSDDSRKILSEYAERFPDKTRVLFNETNSGGVFKQWSKGIKSAGGEICWIAESDDFCDFDFIEKLIPAFNDSKVKFSYARYVFVNSDGEELKTFSFDNYVSKVGSEKWQSSYCQSASSEVNDGMGIINTIPNVSGAMFVNPATNPILDDENWLSMRLCGDWTFYLRLLCGGKVSYSVDTHSYYRFHEASTAKAVQATDNYFIEHCKVAKLVCDLYDIDDEVIKRHYKVLKAEHDYMATKPSKPFDELFNLDELIEYNHNSKKKPKVSDSVYTGNVTKEALKPRDTVIATYVSLKEDKSLTFEEKMNNVGANTGNMMFANALKNQLDVKKTAGYYGGNFADMKNISCVIPSANFIICGDAIEEEGIKFLESTDFPVTLAGLGAQANAMYNTPKKLVEALNPEKITFFKMVSERAVSLGIRGAFTAECLEIMGIHNYRIIGCPSFYKYMDGVMPEFKKPSANKTVMTVTRGNKYESMLVNFGKKHNSDWVIQMNTELPFIESGKEYPNQLVKQFFPGVEFNDEMFSYMKEHRKIFFDIDEWGKYLTDGNFTFAYGSRFHGNMNAFIHGIPTLWIAHDNRTKELAEALHLPHISYNTFESIDTMEELIEYCDVSETVKHYPKLLENYKLFLSENGLTIKE